MLSFKSQLIIFILKHTRKKSFASVEGMHKRLKDARQSQDFRPPETVKARVDIVERDIGGTMVYEVKAKGSSPEKRMIYLHGGAYLFEITAHHWDLIAEIAERLPFQISVPIYPLAPETQAPAIVDSGMDEYRDVLANVAPENIVFMGDSAGGNMAVVMGMEAAIAGLPQPARMVLISPAMDLSMSNPAIFEVEKSDPWLGTPGGKEATRLYAGELSPTDWRISPLYGDIAVLPPMLLLTGTRDILNPDTHLFVEKARAAGIAADLIETKGMFHVWPLLDFPEGRKAREQIIAYLK